jgi:hypothetical protein
MSGSASVYVSSVKATVAWPSRSDTTFGWTPARSANVTFRVGVLEHDLSHDGSAVLARRRGPDGYMLMFDDAELFG